MTKVWALVCMLRFFFTMMFVEPTLANLHCEMLIDIFEICVTIAAWIWYEFIGNHER